LKRFWESDRQLLTRLKPGENEMKNRDLNNPPTSPLAGFKLHHHRFLAIGFNTGELFQPSTARNGAVVPKSLTL
jgi:hypothetical protein